MPEAQTVPARRVAALKPSLPASGAGDTVLAFDYGEKRLGVAVGDARLRTAHALAVIDARGGARLEAVARLVAEWQPARLVLGLPTRDDGAPHRLAQKVQRFAAELETRFRLPVARVDERYSSVEAEARLREAAGARRAAQASRERELDARAAQVLLEQYFDERPA